MTQVQLRILQGLRAGQPVRKVMIEPALQAHDYGWKQGDRWVTRPIYALVAKGLVRLEGDRAVLLKPNWG
jgi:hypothetical protein